MKKKNIFVIGDLVIDHTIFVHGGEDIEERHQPVSGEKVYEVLRRVDTAGGAANTARVLAVLNQGITYLWGVIGHSHWGSFRSILEHSQRLDGARSNIEFRGVQDEADAQMNTVTRLIMINGDPPDYHHQRHHEVRFDDYGHLHISDNKRESVLYYLERAHEKHGLEAIILNDLDMGCLTPELVRAIAAFAQKQSYPIPLFIDPKRTPNKYDGIEATAILPNLSEWCHLTGQGGKAFAEWRTRIDNQERLTDMAMLSLRRLPNFKYHIVKCDALGVVIFAPHPSKKHHYAIYRIPPFSQLDVRIPHQLGCGDVMTGIFALEYSSDDFQIAFQRANAVVSCYLDMPWVEMPNAEMVEARLRNPFGTYGPIADCSLAIQYLPKDLTIDVLDHETIVEDLISQDDEYRQKLKEIYNDLLNLNQKTNSRSVILAAPSGCGKTTLIRTIERRALDLGFKVIDYSAHLGRLKPTTLDDRLQRLCNKHLKGSETQLLLMVDEAWKKGRREVLEESGVDLLNSASKYNIRFWFVDAAFAKEDGRLPLSSEMSSRCTIYHLTGFDQRPRDIPYALAAQLRKQGQKHNIRHLLVEGTLMLQLTEEMLISNPRNILVGRIEEAFGNALNEQIPDGQLTVRLKHLSTTGSTATQMRVHLPHSVQLPDYKIVIGR